MRNTNIDVSGPKLQRSKIAALIKQQYHLLLLHTHNKLVWWVLRSSEQEQGSKQGTGPTISITSGMVAVSTLDLIDAAIAELEARLNLQPGESVTVSTAVTVASKDRSLVATEIQRKRGNNKSNSNKNNSNKAAVSTGSVAPAASAASAAEPTTADLPEICKLEFKVGVITKVWIHEKADKLYCEEIDVGEAEPRQIASGLRPHFTAEQMLGQRLLVVSNLKAKNLVGFKSHGMVLCAVSESVSVLPAEVAADNDETSTTTTTERVEFVEPPPDAPIGEVVTFEGLPPPQPWSAAQVEKRKVFAACLDGMRTLDDGQAAWNGHVFTTSAGPCRAKTVMGGLLR